MKVCLQGSDQVRSHTRNSKNWDSLNDGEKTRGKQKNCHLIYGGLSFERGVRLVL